MRIGIVNDVPLIAEALRRVIAHTQEHQVLWVAHGGAQALALCADNRPDLILMDLVMPGLDGVETTRQIMQSTPCAILVVTASPEENTNLVFRALGAGAMDVTATPVLSGSAASDTALLTKIRTISKLIHADAPATGSGLSSDENTLQRTKAGLEALVVIGASTGGPIALAKILREWHPSENNAAVIVQHIDQQFTDHFANWLSDQVHFPISVIEDGDRLAPGKIYMAKTNDHLVLDAQHQFHYSPKPVNYPYRPSVDVFFHCVAKHWHKKAVGVLLTGMGRDGAQGLLALRRAGKLTIAQDESTSAVYGMPRAAADIGAAEMILPLSKISVTLQDRGN